jgi:sugar lactone lactonase YvrE
LQAHLFDSKGAKLPEAPRNFRRLGQATVGETAEAHTLTLRFTQAQTLTGLKTTGDFQIDSGGSCAEGNRYQSNASCTVLVRFVPRGAGSRIGRLSVSSDLSIQPLAFGLGGYGYSPIVSFIPSQISTVAGTYPSSVGLLSGAQYLTVDGGDTLWVADTGNNLVRQKDSSGNFVTLASGYTGVLGIAVDTFGEAYFDVPSNGNMYEIYNYGPVVVISGSGSDNCTAASPCSFDMESLSSPGAMSMDPDNRLFFVDGHNGAAFSTVQPTAPNLIFLYDPFPYQTNPTTPIAVDSGDNLYSFWSNGGECEILQSTLYNAENGFISFNKVAGGHTCGFAGDGGLAGNAELGAKAGQIVFDTAGNLYFTDTDNQRVRRIDSVTGVIRTIAGDGTAGYTGDSGAATAATLRTPTGVGVDSTGSVYIISNSASSGSAQVIRKVGPSGYLNFGSVLKGTTPTNPTQLIVSNTGNSAMVLSAYSFSGTAASDFKIVPGSTTCNLTAGATLDAGQTCYIAISFTPGATGTRQATFRLATNTVAGYNDTTLTGAGTLPVPTMTITSPASGSSFPSGTAVNFAVSVTGSPVPTGTVQFKVDGANYGSLTTLSSTGTASISVTSLTQTTHTVSATYSGSSVANRQGHVL